MRRQRSRMPVKFFSTNSAPRCVTSMSTAPFGVPRPEVSVERVDALERSPAGKVQIVVADR